MSWQRIDPPLWIETPRGIALAHWLIDYGVEMSLYWVCVLEDGACWRLPNEQIRFPKNYTAERPSPDKP